MKADQIPHSFSYEQKLLIEKLGKRQNGLLLPIIRTFLISMLKKINAYERLFIYSTKKLHFKYNVKYIIRSTLNQFFVYPFHRLKKADEKVRKNIAAQKSILKLNRFNLTKINLEMHDSRPLSTMC